MNLEQFFQDYLEEFQKGTENHQAYAMNFFLHGCMGMYDKTKQVQYLDVVKSYMENFITVDGSLKEGVMTQEKIEHYSLGPILYFLLLRTKETRYEKAIKELGKTLHTLHQGQNPLFEQEELNTTDLLMMQPFYTLYDTIYNKKEHYLEIMDQFHQMDQLPDNAKKALLFVECFSGMSEEIYEHYFTLLKITKHTIKEVLAHAKLHHLLSSDEKKLTKESLENSIITAYAVLKACHHKILLAEKYEDMGASLFHASMEVFVSHQKESSVTGVEQKLEWMGLFMMAYSYLPSCC